MKQIPILLLLFLLPITSSAKDICLQNLFLLGRFSENGKFLTSESARGQQELETMLQRLHHPLILNKNAIARFDSYSQSRDFLIHLIDEISRDFASSSTSTLNARKRIKEKLNDLLIQLDFPKLEEAAQNEIDEIAEVISLQRWLFKRGWTQERWPYLFLRSDSEKPGRFVIQHGLKIRTRGSQHFRIFARATIQDDLNNPAQMRIQFNSLRLEHRHAYTNS